MSFVRRSVSPPNAIAFRDPMARTYAPGFRKSGVSGLGFSLATTAGDASVGTAVGGPVGGVVGAVAGAVSSIFGGSTPDQMKNIWDVVPFSLIRITGGHGVWHDPLTNETLTDAQTDLRKSAVVASSINAFNDLNNHWYDATTQQYLNGAAALQRWQAKFGPLSFANAYAAYPGAFQIFSPITTTGDPISHSPSALPVVLATPTTALGPINTIPTTLPVSTVPYNPSTAGPAQVAAQPIVPMPVNQASILSGVSGSTGLLILGGLVVGLLFMNRKSSMESAS